MDLLNPKALPLECTTLSRLTDVAGLFLIYSLIPLDQNMMWCFLFFCLVSLFYIFMEVLFK